MSIQWINWVLGGKGGRGTEPGLRVPTGVKRLVLLALANHADEDGYCWPSIETICREANSSERRTHDAIRWLLETGYISRRVNGAPKELSSGQYRSNLYRLQADAEVGVDASSHPDTNRGGNPVRSGVDVPSDQGWTSRPQEPSGEPSVEPSSLSIDAEASTTFPKFWSRYPRKLDKTAAFGRFKAALRVDDVETVMGGLQRWCQYWTEANTGQQFIPHPATWLNRRRYLDTTPPVQTARGGPSVIDTFNLVDAALGNDVAPPSAD